MSQRIIPDRERHMDRAPPAHPSSALEKWSETQQQHSLLGKIMLHNGVILHSNGQGIGLGVPFAIPDRM